MQQLEISEVVSLTVNLLRNTEKLGSSASLPVIEFALSKLFTEDNQVKKELQRLGISLELLILPKVYTSFFDSPLRNSIYKTFVFLSFL